MNTGHFSAARRADAPLAGGEAELWVQACDLLKSWLLPSNKNATLRLIATDRPTALLVLTMRGFGRITWILRGSGSINRVLSGQFASSLQTRFAPVMKRFTTMVQVCDASILRGHFGAIVLLAIARVL